MINPLKQQQLKFMKQDLCSHFKPADSKYSFLVVRQFVPKADLGRFVLEAF